MLDPHHSLLSAAVVRGIFWRRIKNYPVRLPAKPLPPQNRIQRRKYIPEHLLPPLPVPKIRGGLRQFTGATCAGETSERTAWTVWWR